MFLLTVVSFCDTPGPTRIVIKTPYADLIWYHSLQDSLGNPEIPYFYIVYSSPYPPVKPVPIDTCFFLPTQSHPFTIILPPYKLITIFVSAVDSALNESSLLSSTDPKNELGGWYIYHDAIPPKAPAAFAIVR